MLEASHSPLLCDIARHAMDTPDKIALVVGNCRVSYSRLVEQIGGAAAFLQSLGLK